MPFFLRFFRPVIRSHIDTSWVHAMLQSGLVILRDAGFAGK